MENQALISNRLKSALSGTILLYALYLTGRHNFLLFHSIAEIFGIVIACGIFMVAWNSRRIAKNSYMLFIGIAYLFVGFLDLLHTLSYKGMGVFQGYGANLPTQLWIAARFMESISLLAAVVLIGRNIKARTILTGYSIVASLLLGSIFYGNIFPDCFIEGSGLTPFKKISEYIISLTLGLSLFVLYKKQKRFDRNVFRLLAASIFVTILSELSFTFYIDVYGLSNLTGHYLKIISFYLIYKAIIQSGLMKPYDLLFRDLKQSEARFRSLVEQAGDAMFLLDLNGKLLDVNHRACEYLGYTQEELLSLSLSDVDIVFSREKFSRFKQELRKDKPATVVSVLQRKDKTIFPAEIRIGFIDVQEKPHLLALVRDITERKHAEEERTRLQKRIEAQWNIALLVDADMKTVCDQVLAEIVNMTGSKYGFYGFLNEDESLLIVHSWSKEVTNDCGMQVKPLTFSTEKSGLWGNAVRERRSMVVNDYPGYAHPDKQGIPDGHVSITRFISVPIFRRNRIVAVGAVANKPDDYTGEEVTQMEAFLQSAWIIQERQQTEEELKRHREHLMELVEERTSELQNVNMELEQEIAERIRAEKQMKLMALFTELNPSPVLRFNIHGEVLMANKAAMDTLKISSIEEVRIKSLLPGIEALDLTNCIYKGAILSHSARIGDRYYHFIIKGLPELGFGQIYSTDVTEQKKAEAETMRASHLASIGELAAGVAHEINNPINGIINYTQMLANKSAPDSMEHDITSRIIREGDRIAGIVSNLLTFARDGREKPQHVHISDIISDSLALTATQIRKDGIRLNVDIQEQLPLIFVRPKQIQQVLLNLISNARHALNQKFPEEQEEKVLNIIAEKSVKDHHPYIRITCHDRGTGIPDDIMNKVMNPFFTTKPTGIGTGLGLSISHGIITDHGGSISIDSTEGEFTKVIIELPVHNERQTE